jgi:hypothetical protein
MKQNVLSDFPLTDFDIYWMGIYYMIDVKKNTTIYIKFAEYLSYSSSLSFFVFFS